MVCLGFRTNLKSAQTRQAATTVVLQWQSLCKHVVLVKVLIIMFPVSPTVCRECELGGILLITHMAYTQMKL